jgi:energy-coupling factor transporter ATP-binding protein EcfA2
MMPFAPIDVHATGVILADRGVLIRGASGSGKSTLARKLIDAMSRMGRFGCLVGDDRLRLERFGDRIVASGHQAIMGQLEIRGLGISSIKFQDDCVLHLLVDCEPVLRHRFPDGSDTFDSLMGLSLRRIAVTPEHADLVLTVLGFSEFRV